MLRCGCLTCHASDRLYALADVFEVSGDYSAADCCREWALRTRSIDVLGTQMAAAIVHGRESAWSDTPTSS